jgi:hypothetical protein
MQQCPNITLQSLYKIIDQLPVLQILDISQWGKRNGEKFVSQLHMYCMQQKRNIEIISDYPIDTLALQKKVDGFELTPVLV